VNASHLKQSPVHTSHCGQLKGVARYCTFLPCDNLRLHLARALHFKTVDLVVAFETVDAIIKCDLSNNKPLRRTFLSVVLCIILYTVVLAFHSVDESWTVTTEVKTSPVLLYRCADSFGHFPSVSNDRPLPQFILRLFYFISCCKLKAVFLKVKNILTFKSVSFDYAPGRLCDNDQNTASVILPAGHILMFMFCKERRPGQCIHPTRQIRLHKIGWESLTLNRLFLKLGSTVLFPYKSDRIPFVSWETCKCQVNIYIAKESLNRPFHRRCSNHIDFAPLGVP